MKLSGYIIRSDSGFSPNPFGRVCTLACCRPVIRRNSKVDQGRELLEEQAAAP
ncbi:MAG: hypothetical protein IH898_07380 [Planctomycetes bacterium]|nr:hypothetical protein [Planctomycetota bacterium]